jgi:nucleoside-diphosphate-sugar epimerase
MSSRSVLFVGGTGTISAACVSHALDEGFEVTVFNRGRTTDRPVPDGVRVLKGDARDAAAVRDLVRRRGFDSVVNFLIWTTDQVRSDIETFAGKTGQYVFISSASAYQKPVARLPITESTPLSNPFWQYSRDKMACEDVLVRAYRQEGFPATIVRPSHTYDKTMLPFEGGWTVLDRMRRGRPVVVHGDGTSLWVLTHHEDFAQAFVRLLASPQAIGDAFHITSDEVLTWDQIHHIVAGAAGTEARLVHVSSEEIAQVLPCWGPPLLGDKSHSVIFDNSKVRQLVPGWTATIPFTQGAREMIEWFDGDASRQTIDMEVDQAMDSLSKGR